MGGASVLWHVLRDVGGPRSTARLARPSGTASSTTWTNWADGGADDGGTGRTRTALTRRHSSGLSGTGRTCIDHARPRTGTVRTGGTARISGADTCRCGCIRAGRYSLSSAASCCSAAAPSWALLAGVVQRHGQLRHLATRLRELGVEDSPARSPADSHTAAEQVSNHRCERAEGRTAYSSVVQGCHSPSHRCRCTRAPS